VELLSFEGFSLDPRRRLLFGANGTPIPLAGRAFDTLLYLVEHAGELVDKQTLMKAVWPIVIVDENNLSQTISALRRVLGEIPGEHRFIVTMPAHERLVFGVIHAVQLVLGDVALDPLHARAQTAKNTEGLLRDPLEFDGAELAGTGDIALDHKFRHGCLLVHRNRVLRLRWVIHGSRAA
jgi:Transcriptional regulatory protein, C terminal